MSVLETITIDGKTHELPSGASVTVNDDNLIIQNKAGGQYLEHTNGTFVSASDRNGRVTVEIGFKPDVLKVTLPFSNGDTYAVYNSTTFKDKTYWWIPMENSTRFYNIPDTGDGETGIVEITDTGFVFRSYAGNTCGVECTYEAMKFMPRDNKHSYSTEEQVVGTWIDGKPVYERTYIFITEPTTEGVNSSTIVNAPDNIDNIIQVTCTIKTASTIHMLPIFNLSFNRYVRWKYEITDNVFVIDNNLSSFGLKEAMMIVRYTKTTD